MDRFNPAPVFRGLGEEIGRRWAQRDGRLEAFSEIATAALRESDIFERVTLENVARWFVLGADVPVQHNRPFGQPPVRVYQSEQFYIELLFWIDSPTAIHQHAFAGAFGVLRGSSYHSCYRFRASERITPALALGDLEFHFAEILQIRDVRPIELGDRFIHALLHLEPPSISVVVRTIHVAAYMPQFNFYPPGLAYDRSTVRSLCRRASICSECCIVTIGRCSST